MNPSWKCNGCSGDYTLILPRSDRERLGMEVTDLESLLRPRLVARAYRSKYSMPMDSCGARSIPRAT